MKQYRIIDIEAGFFQTDVILKAESPKKAMQKYAEWHLKLNDYSVTRTDGKSGRFVVYGNGKSFVYDIAS